jgi:protein-S-isoprenylcysteine O-methyltransferase Ste14
MNTFNRPFDQRPSQAKLDTLQARFGLRIAAALDEHADTALSTDIETRLRFAREQAMARAKLSQAQVASAAAPAVVSNGASTASLGGGSSSAWWTRVGVMLPLVVLVLGLLWIDRSHTRAQIEAAAEVDADLLADDLPPEAYRDPGFAEFLKSSRR